MAASRAILSTTQPRSKRAPITHKDDKHMQHGQLLLDGCHAPSSLERLLAVAKLCVTFLTDLLRRSDDTQDIPLLILGHHYISHRVLRDPHTVSPAAATAQSAPATSTPPAAAAAPPTAAAAAAAADASDAFRAYVQEICTFDSREGPKTFVDTQGSPQAICALCLEPTAIAKSKRLGRELSIKVSLQPTGSSSTGRSSVRLLGYGEDYTISWPSLLFLNPISLACSLAYKGDLEIICPQSGLCLTLTFVKDHSVRGTIEQLTPHAGGTKARALMDSPPPTQADINKSSSSSLPLGGVGSSSSGLGVGAVSAKPQVVGSLEGSWMGVINVTCPQMGLEGVMYDVKALNPAPVPSVDLRHMGPMRISRFWSAVHDALLYADPRAASGGRSAMKLASTLGHYLTALILEGAAARDVGAAAGSTTGSNTGAVPTRSAPSVGSAATDPDLEEFDRQAEGLAGGRSDALQDTRAVPPCFKEQHALGHKLRYQLHYTLTSTD